VQQTKVYAISFKVTWTGHMKLTEINNKCHFWAVFILWQRITSFVSSPLHSSFFRQKLKIWEIFYY